MTAEEIKSIPARSGSPFTFTVDGSAFNPPAGATLRFASMDVDTLVLPGLPVGLVSRGSVVTVSYNGVIVFRGKPTSRVERWGRGDTHYEDVTFEGPWGNLARCVFQQEWSVRSVREDGTPVTMGMSTSRIVLNVDELGEPIDMTEQLCEIAGFAAAKCGFSYSKSAISAGVQVLPADEAQNITCAAAIIRTLRFFPKMVARFDYSKTTPVLHIGMPEATTASWCEGAKVLSRTLSRTDHPIVGVRISTSPGFVRITAGGQEFDTRKLDTQSAGDTDSIDCLHVYLPLEKGGGSNEYETLDCNGHVKDFWDVTSCKDKVFFWKQYHPRLKDVLQSNITIDPSSVKVVNPLDPDEIVTPFKYLTDLTVGELRHFGKNAVACRFCCKVKVETSDDIEEDILLTMDFVTTDAVQRTYTQMVSMSSQEGETLPEGLASALLAQRAGELESEDLVVRLGGTLPTIGDSKDGLFLQSMEVNCNELTADLHFGHPSYLSAEEMRDLLNGFRSRSMTTSQISRDNPGTEGGEVSASTGIQPLSSTEFCPGKKNKTTVKQSKGGGGSSITMDASGGGGSIDLKTSALQSGETVSVHTLTYTDKDGATKTYKVLADKDVEIEGGGGEGDPPPTGDKTVTDIEVVGPGDDNPYANAKLKITYSDKTENFIQITSAEHSNVKAKAVNGNLELGVYYT